MPNLNPPYANNDLGTFFDSEITDRDPAIAQAIQMELNRQQTQIELIASENIVSRAVMEAQGGARVSHLCDE